MLRDWGEEVGTEKETEKHWILRRKTRRVSGPGKSMKKDEERNCIKCCSQTEYDVCWQQPQGLAMQRSLELDQSSATGRACDSLTGKDYEECRAVRRGTERGEAGEKREV